MTAASYPHSHPHNAARQMQSTHTSSPPPLSAPAATWQAAGGVASTTALPAAAASDMSDIELVGLEDPRNWSSSHKWITAGIISFMGFISPLGSSIVVPGSPIMDRDYNLSSKVISLLPVSLFVFGLGLGPFLLAPISELKGRQPVYLISSIVFVLFNIACAVAPNFAALVVLRFFAGAAGSAGPSLGAGSIGDMFAPNERGRAQSLYGLGPLMGPVCGTIAGGFLSQEVNSWRWLLWLLTILSGLVVFSIAFGLEETYAPVLLQQKKKRVAAERLKHLDELARGQLCDLPAPLIEAQRQELRKVLNSGPPELGRVGRLAHSLYPGPEARKRTKLALTRPFRLLFTNPICAIFSVYMGFIYGIIFLFLTQHPLLYQMRDRIVEPDVPPPERLPTYGWRPGKAGLTYLGLGLGFLTAAAINVVLQDAIYRRLTASDGKIGWFLFDTPEQITQMMLNRKEAVLEDTNDVEASVAMPAERDLAPGGEKVAPPLVSPAVVLDEKTHAALTATGDLVKPAPSLVKKGKPEYRLPLCLLGMIILPCGLLTFGWAANERTHWIAPLVGSYLVGAGSILCFQVILVFLVDAFVPYSASATACAVLVRCVLAAILPLIGQPLFVRLGYGNGCSVLAGIAALAIPVPILLWLRGESLRLRFKFTG